MLGGTGSPYLKVGQWQFLSGYRGLNSEQHYTGDRANAEITSGVVNSQHIFDQNVTYALSEQFNVSLNVPYFQGGFSLLVGPSGNQRRQVVRSSGVGDIVLTGRYWLMGCETHPKANVACELGFKFPTGKHDATDRIVGRNGQDPQSRPVDQSIQPGDGGFGVVVALQGFRQSGDVMLFLSGTYLINPRNTNGTQTFFSSLGGLGGPNAQYNSVPDQYLVRGGLAFPFRGVKGMSFSLAGRVEGVPVDDLIGDSDGFRRPGYSIFVEPGINYSRGDRAWSLSVPITTYRNVLDNPRTERREDATLADYIVLFSFSQKFGGSVPRS